MSNLKDGISNGGKSVLGSANRTEQGLIAGKGRVVREVRKQVELELGERKRDQYSWRADWEPFSHSKEFVFESNFNREPLKNLVSVVPLDIRFRVRSQ